MAKRFALCALAIGSAGLTAAATAGPAVCVGTITELELLHRVRQDAYFKHGASPGKPLRIEYDGCGYRIHVDTASAGSRGDLLLVDRYGHVTRVVHQR